MTRRLLEKEPKSILCPVAKLNGLPISVLHGVLIHANDNATLLLKFQLERGADINDGSYRGCSPLFIAISNH